VGEDGETASRAAIEKRARGRATIAERDLFIGGMTQISCAFIDGVFELLCYKTGVCAVYGYDYIYP
jgi:hypothetical protein